MHFHLPKPMHGWRELVGEVGIIVVGVLIALGAEQLVETVHERRVANETRDAIRAEFNNSLASLALRGQSEPCVARRLGEVRQILITWGQTGSFDTPRWVAQAPQFDQSLARYQAAVSAGRLALLPSAEQYRIGTVAADLGMFESIQDQERPLWGKLRALQMGADALSASDRTMILEALQEAATLDYRARISIRQSLPFAREAGYTPDFSEIRRTMGRVYKGGHFTPSICTSIDTPADQANRAQITPLPL